MGAGVTVVQLRDEDATDDELVKLGRQVMKALEGTDVALIINNRVHLVEAIGAHGGHVAQSDLGIGEARALPGSAAYLGLSVQTVEHVATARQHGAICGQSDVAMATRALRAAWDGASR